ncbi:MAG: bifunctional diaminohydroxyphosphoribosylaminopyrimidine deaminase/5-amino-6-(5-phosphoribosylamino)uracil reductase RibD [Candidatus Omnitrophica bacterium]|nr:bifunctional diaminohydroxyphosphoribosylaminopyrimidine deaminase/5-amino-6-(5-phosphoribosylamino)uracil reductase RibD [Candidatus Omnitrophota bacterium]MCG2702815.1 bifunctional diaminohydroxyphosphoribosylaminopyrimidine deaminase/5-amino-6-(5-phosphoribosylamino)uracil reductase RibD [Candidatus Omnitrophota bacterium]
MNKADNRFLQLTILLAKKGEGLTSPNPLVGAVIVKNGKMIATGYHQRCGGAHAEVNALRKAGDAAKNAALYVNLEPCNHFGRTPPCTQAIINAGIKRVVIGIRDPNPLTSGKGLAALKKAGISVSVAQRREGVEYRRLNEIFFKYIVKKMPFVAVKAGQSLDGRIATKTGNSRWITSAASRNYVQSLRNKYDAVMVGINTILKDDPCLSCRDKGKVKADAPVKIIVDDFLKTPPNARIFSAQSPAPVIIAATNKASRKKIKIFTDMGIDVLVCPLDANGRVELRYLMEELAAHEITSVLVEGGGELNGSCFDARLADKIYFFVAPKIIGGKEAVSSVEGIGVADLKSSPLVTNIEIVEFRGDILIQGDVRYN